MKRFIAITILAAMLLGGAGCADRRQTANADPTNIPTQSATEAPTAAPTEAPAPEPTAAPAPKLLDFDDCAELICTLPWGQSELEVYCSPGNESEGTIPLDFFVDSGEIWIFDQHGLPDMGFIVYDLETGGVSRTTVAEDDDTHFYIRTRFAVYDGKLVGQRCVCELDTGERYLLQPLVFIQEGFEDDYLRLFQIREGGLYAYIGYVQYGYEPNMEDLTEYVFDPENRMWSPVRKILESGGKDEFVFTEGGFRIPRGYYIGQDNEGNHYLQSSESYKDADGTLHSPQVILKYAPDGHLISKLSFDPFGGCFGEDMKDYPAPYRFSLVTEDGTVWLMLNLEGGLRIYKVNM